MHLRNKLFALRDRLIRYEIENGLKPEVKVLNNSINSSISNLHHFNFFDFLRFKSELAKESKFTKTLSKRTQLIKGSDEEIKEIAKLMSEIVFSAMSINIGSWLPLIAPLVFTYDFFKNIVGFTQDMLFSITLNREDEAANLFRLRTT